MPGRKRWLLPVAVVCVVGGAAALLGTTGRFLAKPAVVPTASTVRREFSHPVAVSKTIASGTGQDVEAAGGFVFGARPSHSAPILRGPFGLSLPLPNLGHSLQGTDEANKALGDVGSLSGQAVQFVRVTVSAKVDPSPLQEDSDAEVQIDVKTDVAPTLRDQIGQETVRLESDSFKVRPSEPRILDLRQGAGIARYVITPISPGDKMLRVFAKHSDGDEHEEILKVTVVRAASAYLGVDSRVWAALQAGGAVIGLPSLLLLIVTRWLDARKKKAEDKQAVDPPKIILPK